EERQPSGHVLGVEDLRGGGRRLRHARPVLRNPRQLVRGGAQLGVQAPLEGATEEDARRHGHDDEDQRDDADHRRHELRLQRGRTAMEHATREHRVPPTAGS
ncbi:hypothetical protein ABE10_00580, partial [Bacillus toyonensis]|nr:hypothetical protein [Bacillus toyonensis]